MNRLLRILALAVLAIAMQARADKPLAEYPGLSETVMQRLGGEYGLKVVIDQLYGIVSRDSRLNSVLLRDAAPERVAAQKAALMQTLLGRPAVAPGTRSEGIRELTDTQYNALVEDLYQALEDTHVSYNTANRVLASIAPYGPAFVSAYLLPEPTVNGRMGVVTVGMPELQRP